MSKDVRANAARVVADVLGGQSLNRGLPAALEQTLERDRPLLQQLCYGTLRMAPRLEALLTLLFTKPLKDKDRDIHALAMLGLYQLDATRIPAHAAVSETVGATRALKKPWAKGLLNAVLRRYQREREELLGELDDAALASHPEWLYRAYLKQWPEQAAAIIAANNEQPPMTLRVNRRHGARDDYLNILAAQDIAAGAGRLSPAAVCLAQPQDVTSLPGFGAGDVSVQDESAQVAALLLDAQPGDRVLDACAAPGGKTCHILESEPAIDELVALELDGDRLARVEENLERLDLFAALVQGDAAAPPAELEPASFDRILVDAPCSASGVVRRNPDVKILRRQGDLASFAAQQSAILDGAWPLLKPGGQLLYATCSVLREENDAVIKRFVEEHDDAAVVPLQLDGTVATDVGVQILPSVSGGDGLYYSALEKRGQ
ncbi:MAG: 16S rRNA (cytosine(967)-C(5))-methyltransferase RsmB [Halioglobus sp.]|nr:16S rRNA (cytosine(967)-C(5))-methyltransferase RsmB [Halioglobus sp.]